MPAQQIEPLPSAADPGSSLYLDLLKKALTASLYDESAWVRVEAGRSVRQRDASHPRTYVTALIRSSIVRYLEKKGLMLLKRQTFNLAKRQSGMDWPLFGYTMIGHKRLDNLQTCIEDVLAQKIAGDFIETGVWRGGCCILMRAVLKHAGDTTRRVWVADSFQGLPQPKTNADGADLSHVEHLAVSLDQVRANFARFGCLDEQVMFLEGWFSDTLPTAPIEKLAILRLDGDLYSSTMDALNALYGKVSDGGYVIVDDYGTWPSCRRAVDEFIAIHGIHADIKMIDETGVFWQVRR